MGMSKSRWPLVLGAGALVGAGAGLYFALQHWSKGDLGLLSAAKLVPDDAIAVAYLSTNPAAWEKLQKFGTPEAHALLAKSMASFDQSLLTSSGISYEKDLKPWLGDVMIGVLPPTAAQPVQDAAGDKTSPQILLVVGIRDKISALQFANKLKNDKQRQAQITDYNGETIISSQSDGETTHVSFLDDHLVVSEQLALVQQAIDAYKGDPSFASKADVKELAQLGSGVSEPLAQLYLPDYGGLIQQWLATDPQSKSLSPETLKQLNALKSVVAGVGVDPLGVRMKAIATMAPDQKNLPIQVADGKVTRQLPADTVLLISGQNMSQQWKFITEQSQSNPDFKRSLDLARGGLQTMDLDLDRDIFGWMNGEYAIGVIPVKQGILANVGIGGVIIADTRDRAVAETAFSKFDKLAANFLASPKPQKVGNKNVTTWNTFLGPVAGHGWLDSDTVFLATGEPLISAIAAPQGKTLSEGDLFKQLTKSLPNPNGGYFYLNMEELLQVMARSPQLRNQVLPPETRAVLDSIRGLGATSTVAKGSSYPMDLILVLKPKP
jgi:hypothetical protein